MIILGFIGLGVIIAISIAAIRAFCKASVYHYRKYIKKEIH